MMTPERKKAWAALQDRELALKRQLEEVRSEKRQTLAAALQELMQSGSWEFHRGLNTVVPADKATSEQVARMARAVLDAGWGVDCFTVAGRDIELVVRLEQGIQISLASANPARPAAAGQVELNVDLRAWYEARLQDRLGQVESQIRSLEETRDKIRGELACQK